MNNKGHILRAALAIFSGLAIVLSSVYARAGFDFDAAIRQSAELSDAGEHKQALDALLMAGLHAAPTDRPKLHAARGRAHGRSGDYFNAIIEYGRAARDNGGDFCMFAERALFFESIGEYGQARADAALAASGGCSSSALLALDGRISMVRGDFARAIRPLVESIDGGASMPDTLADISTAYLAAGLPAVAAEYARAASDLRPGDAHLFSLLADALSMSGDYDESIDAYKRALKIDPSRDITANNFGFTLFASGRLEEARDVIDELNSRAANAYALCNAVEIRLHEENFAEAYGYGRLCVEEMSKQRGLAHYERYYIKAISTAMEAITRDRGELHPLTQLDLAAQLEEKGDLAGALAHSVVATMLEPSNIAAHYEAGRLYAALGDIGRSGALLETAARVSSPGSNAARSARRLIFNATLRLIH